MKRSYAISHGERGQANVRRQARPASVVSISPSLFERPQQAQERIESAGFNDQCLASETRAPSSANRKSSGGINDTTDKPAAHTLRARSSMRLRCASVAG